MVETLVALVFPHKDPEEETAFLFSIDLDENVDDTLDDFWWMTEGVFQRRYEDMPEIGVV